MGQSMSETAPPQVSIIVVNWNGQNFLDDCLSCLFSQTYVDREIILVDNNSSDASVGVVQEKFPAARIVRLSVNEGFTGGNAAGLRIATGEFIALVNNDTRTDRRWLERLVEPMIKDPTVGICAAKLIFDGTDRLNSAGDGLTTAGVGFNGGLNRPINQCENSELVFGACGAAVLYRRKMLDEIGFLDDDFFLYDEDTDLNFRAQLAGWKCAYVPDAIVYHKCNGTAGRLSDTHVYYHTRNLEFVWIKNMPLGLMVRFAHHKLVQEIGSFCYLCLRHGQWRSFFKAKRDAFRMLPTMWRKRRGIQARRRVSNAHVRSQLTPMLTGDFVRLKFRQLIDG